MILSIFQHISGYTEKIDNLNTYLDISGTHSFPTFIHHKECQHGPLPATDRKPYMAPGQKLIDLVIFLIFVQMSGFLSKIIVWCPMSNDCHVVKYCTSKIVNQKYISRVFGFEEGHRGSTGCSSSQLWRPGTLFRYYRKNPNTNSSAIGGRNIKQKLIFFSEENLDWVRPPWPKKSRFRETPFWNLKKVFLNSSLTIQSLCKRGRMNLWTRWQHSNIWGSLFLTGEYIYLMMKASGQIYTKSSVGRWHGQDLYWGHWTSIWAEAKTLQGDVTDRSVSKLRSSSWNLLHNSIICTVQKGRSSSKWVARPIYEAKNYSWKFDLMAKVLLQLSTLLYTLILIDITIPHRKIDFFGCWKMQNIFRCERQHQVVRCLMSDPPTPKNRRQLCAQCVLNSR